MYQHYTGIQLCRYSSVQRANQGILNRSGIATLPRTGVQTELTPEQSSREAFMPLDDFINEVMAIFGQQHTPDEVVATRATIQRWAEREGRFDQAFEMINAKARAENR